MHLRSCSKSQAIISVGTCNSVLFINFPYSEKTGVGQLIFKKEKTVENNSLMPPIYIVTSLTKTKKCMHYCCLKGQSHEIRVWFFWAQWIGKIILIFPRKDFSLFYQRFKA